MDSPVNRAAHTARWHRARQRLLSVDAPGTDAHDLLAQVWDSLQGDIGSDAAALALLTLGDPTAARERLRGALPSGRPPQSDLRALLLARFAAWTADIGLTRELWPGLHHLFDAVSSEAILGELAFTAESIGERHDAERLRARSRPAAKTRWLPDLIDAQSLPPHSAAAVHRVLQFVHETLGAEPDAIRSRLTLKPRLPESCAALRVTNLRLGPAALSLHYTRTSPGAQEPRSPGARHSFILTPVEGAVPIRLILEPAVPGERVAEIKVDGAPATLDVRHAGGRLLCPVQLVLDQTRTLEISAQ